MKRLLKRGQLAGSKAEVGQGGTNLSQGRQLRPARPCCWLHLRDLSRMQIEARDNGVKAPQSCKFLQLPSRVAEVHGICQGRTTAVASPALSWA